MSPLEISEELLEALRKLVRDGKDLKDGWVIAELSLPNITGRKYFFGGGFGGQNGFIDTVKRMCEVGSTGRLDLQALQNVIAGIRSTVGRSEFTNDHNISVCRVHLLSEIQPLQEHLTPLQ